MTMTLTPSLALFPMSRFAVLNANLEEESTEDRDYYLNADTIDMLEAQGGRGAGRHVAPGAGQ